MALGEAADGGAAERASIPIVTDTASTAEGGKAMPATRTGGDGTAGTAPTGAASQGAASQGAASQPTAKDANDKDGTASAAVHPRSSRILNQGHAATRARFLQPIVSKQGSMFLLCARDGDIVPETEHGLYFHDMRYLAGEQLRIDGRPLEPLLANASDGNRAVFELSNPDLVDEQGDLRVGKETLGIRRVQALGDEYDETITIRNHSTEAARFGLTIGYGSDFVDMFEVRGAAPGTRGELHRAAWQGSRLTFRYDGADGHERSIELAFSRRPSHERDGAAGFRIDLDAQETWELRIRGRLVDRAPTDGKRLSRPSAAEGPGAEDLRRSRSGAMGEGMKVETDNPLFNEVLVRSMLDLHMLSMRERGQAFFAAGVPWYVALFGRDSLLTAIQMAAFEPRIAANTLRVLASYQGTRIDDEHDEQPGRILHELREGEMANLGEVPQSPYFGTADATPLFLVLLGVHAAWAGSLDLFHELRPNVERCLEWLDRYADSDGDGFADYITRSPKGLRNQGWKDSGNSIVFEDGRLAEPPVALPEVQGYVHLAWTTAADLFRRDGDVDRARDLDERAAGLAAAFDRQFWLDDDGYYAFCRDRTGQFSRSIASNAAATLWTGIIPDGRAARVVRRALEPDMFSGWGVRTLSADDTSYNPIDYQVGSVWPHDNAFIAAGMHRYGFVREASRIFAGIFSAARHFEHYRLPEVFAGYDMSHSGVPVSYPVACSPQAWAAATIPYLLTTAMGLHPLAFDQRLAIRRPWLPEWLHWVQVRGLRVGNGKVDLRFQRSADTTLVAVENVEGDLSVTVEYS